MIKGLTYAIVTTSDVPRARRFFTEKLGLATALYTQDYEDVFFSASSQNANGTHPEDALWYQFGPRPGTSGQNLITGGPGILSGSVIAPYLQPLNNILYTDGKTLLRCPIDKLWNDRWLGSGGADPNAASIYKGSPSAGLPNYPFSYTFNGVGGNPNQGMSTDINSGRTTVQKFRTADGRGIATHVVPHLTSLTAK